LENIVTDGRRVPEFANPSVGRIRETILRGN
jgi:hypothetical protein